MVTTVFSKVFRKVQNLLTYNPPQVKKHFTLSEVESEAVSQNNQADELREAAALFGRTLNLANRLVPLMVLAVAAVRRGGLQTIKELAEPVSRLDNEWQELVSQRNPLDKKISTSLTENEQSIAELYFLPNNKDVIVRNFTIPIVPPVKAMLVYMEGMIDKKILNLTILQPLMLLIRANPSLSMDDLLQTVEDLYIPVNQVSREEKLEGAAKAINGGDTAMFIDGLAEVLVISTKGFEHRSPDRPQMEQSVRGPQVAFSEALRTNTGMMRMMLQTNDLVTEIIPIGTRIPTNCAVMYLESLANQELVAEVKRRIKGISTDFVHNSNVLEQFIEDHPIIPFPTVLSTERPDRVVAHLTEGRVAFMTEGSPFAHIVPMTLFGFFQTTEDFALKYMAGTFMRILRLVSACVTIGLPAMYIAINYYHQEALPTELLLAVAGARERVPFPAILEILLMEFSFELIREAGLRIPGMLGNTIGIVGAIILGQAAVTANIVSPIMVVIISLTGLASFAIPDYTLAFSLRIVRFVFLLLGATLGLLGVAFGILGLCTLLCNMKSFGVPYLAPVVPKTEAGLDVVVRGPVFRQEQRPEYLVPRDAVRQPHISRRWWKK